MSITRSYNKHTDTYYAYDTTYEWDEKLQKKVQRKKCIGKYDPETGEVIPNGRRGRPVKRTIAPKPTQHTASVPGVHETELAEALAAAESLYARIEAIRATVSLAAGELDGLRDSVGALIRRLDMAVQRGRS